LHDYETTPQNISPFVAQIMELARDASNYQETPDVDRLRQDLLYRLRWNIFGALHDIHVVEEPSNPNTILTPFLSHPMAYESLAHPPLNKIFVHIRCCEEKWASDEHEDEWQYQPPAPIIIDHEDGSPITMGKFVTQTHAYLNANREQIFKCEDEMYSAPEDMGDGSEVVDHGGSDGEGGDGDHFLRGGRIPTSAKFCFESVMLNEVDTDEVQILVSLFVEGNCGEALDLHWHQMDMAACREAALRGV
jgi:hypothetical protein